MKASLWRPSLVSALITAIAFGLIVDFNSPSGAQTGPPPVIQAFSFTPQQVDVSTQNALVTFTMHVTAPAGIENVYVYLSNASYGTSVTMYDSTASPPVTGTLTSGTLQDAYLTANLPVYAGTVPGPWTISSVYLRDLAGNFTTLAPTTLPAGSPTVLTVINNPAAPKLNGFSFSPSTVDVTNSNQTVTFNVSAQDLNSADGYGIAYVLVSFIAPASCLGPESPSAAVYIPSSGTTANGVWTGQITIPQYDIIGNWSAYVEVHDTSGAYLVFHAAELQTAGMQAFLTVTGPPNCIQATDSISGTVTMCGLTGPGVAGVKLTLYNSANLVVGTATSDVNGNYTFGALMPGAYSVIESVPSGYIAFSANPGKGSGGTVVSTSEISVTAVGYDTAFQPNNFVICTINTTSPFTTFTQGGWGTAPHGKNPGYFLTTYFSVACPGGIGIGDPSGNHFTFTSAAAIEAFLPQGSGPAALPAGSKTNPTGKGSELWGQELSVKLAVAFSNAGVFHTGLGSLTVQSGPFKGYTVSQIITLADGMLGGTVTPPGGVTFSVINTCLDNINSCFDGGTSNTGFLK